MVDVKDEVREVLRSTAGVALDIDALDDSADLTLAGLTSHASVNLMLALEEAFDIEFPDSMLTRRVFRSVTDIAAAVSQLQLQAA